MENCRQFVERVFTRPRALMKEKTRIWEWIDAYDGPSFAEARDAFIATKKRQEELFERIRKLAVLHDEIDAHTVETYCANEFTGPYKFEEEFERFTQNALNYFWKRCRIKNFLRFSRSERRYGNKSSQCISPNDRAQIL